MTNSNNDPNISAGSEEYYELLEELTTKLLANGKCSVTHEGKTVTYELQWKNNDPNISAEPCGFEFNPGVWPYAAVCFEPKGHTDDHKDYNGNSVPNISENQ